MMTMPTLVRAGSASTARDVTLSIQETPSLNSTTRVVTEGSTGGPYCRGALAVGMKRDEA